MLELTTVRPPPLGQIVGEVNRTLLCLSSTLSPVNKTDPNVTFDASDEWSCLGGGSAPGATTAAPTRKRSSTQYYMAWWQQLAWSTVFAVMVFVAVGGNSIVMWIVLAHRRMRTVTNYFLVNLSVADLLMAVFNCIFNFVYMLNSDWQFGRSYCTVNNFVANVTVAASVFTLTGISIDRYLAIVRPLQPRMSKMSARVTIVVIWVASATLGFPCLLYSTTITYKSSGGQVRTACILIWPDGQPMVSTMDYVYNLVLFIVTYVLPMAAMAGCYSAMGRELWGSRSIGELTQRQVDSIKSKRKVVRMFIIIVLIFAVCWLPYHAYFIYTHHYSSVAYTKYVQHLYLAFYWLAMANSMVNPLIYYWMNARFRQYFKHAVCVWNCQKFRRKEPVVHGVETPPMLARYSHSYSRSRSGTADDAQPRNGGHRAASSSNGNNNPGRQVCVCIENPPPPIRMSQNSSRPIHDLSGNGSSGSRSGRHHHHTGNRRCRHSSRNNNGANGLNNDRRDPNYWRNRNKLLFQLNERREDGSHSGGGSGGEGSKEQVEICEMTTRAPSTKRKVTMETSIDV
ncbi:tachykinin-like peptides receptor 86C [Neocloeon triangulifer]|uniref:tachykinin-like peptides receptor 86C n=1 Tax=Neocloeon triangulifer TaxID=2078957 RepID=UPI00286EBE1A|nr:tachykinin-like peptides receptor 86C [Neocloeon triangulifer]